jgi:cation transport ATPase
MSDFDLKLPIAHIEELIARPAEQRLREYRYRCAQSLVFGLPVLFLEYFGASLGGAESARWVAVLQALLAGWVVYVGAAGMLFEGALLLRRRVTGDFVAAAVACACYLWSVVSTLGVFARGAPWYRPLLFDASVIVVAVWTAVQWHRLRRSARAGA